MKVKKIETIGCFDGKTGNLRKRLSQTVNPPKNSLMFTSIYNQIVISIVCGKYTHSFFLLHECQWSAGNSEQKEDKACPLLAWLLKTKVLLRKEPVQFRDWWISDNKMISSYFWYFSKVSLLLLFESNCWLNNLEVHHNFL